MKEILRLENLEYCYERGKPALQNVSIQIHAGERIAVLGSNGAGKSTFFLCCNGVLKPTQGSIFLRGEQIGKRDADRMKLRKAVGLVFQDPDSQLIAGTVEAEISFGPMNLRLSPEEVRNRVNTAISTLRLEKLRSRPPHMLSGGEKKRVALADILAMQPELLLLDEPASSLDPENTRLLEQHLEQLQQAGMGLVIATHDVNFAWRWADRILVFHQGNLLRDASPELVFSDLRLLKSCGLDQPLLYQVGERFGLSPLPKTVSDLPKEVHCT